MTWLSFTFILVLGVTAVMASIPANVTADASTKSCSITEYVLALQDACGFVSIHGLWPDPEDTCTYCNREPFSISKLSPATLSGMKNFWLNCLETNTNEGFWKHEWSKHGTCSGMSQDAYFSKALSLYRIYSSKCKSTCNLCYDPNFSFKGGCMSIPTHTPAPTPAPTAKPTSASVYPENDEIEVECGDQAAMRSMCVFSVLMFLSYLVQIATLIHFKNDILGAAPANVSVGNRDGIPSFTLSKQPNTPPSDSGSLPLPPTLPFDHNSNYPNTADL